MLFFTISCKSQNKEEITSFFINNKAKFEEFVGFIEKNKTELGLKNNMGVFIDTSLISNPKYQNPYKADLKIIFEFQLFRQISIYEPCNIEFLIDVEVNKILMTETKKIFMYTSKKELPDDYSLWPRKMRLDTNWWYLEFKDSQF